MWKNHIKIAFRTLTKNRLHSLINVAGLAISLAASMLVFLWVWDEWSYDNMHEKGDRIYAITASFDQQSDEFWRVAPPAISTWGKQQIPDIEETTRIKESEPQLLKLESQRFEQVTHHVDPSFFYLFDFPLLSGDREHPFPNPHSVILSENLANKFFDEVDAVGKTLTIGDTDFEVSGVMANPPSNSSLDYELLLPFQQLTDHWKDIHQDWVNFDYETFVLLKPGANPKQVAQRLTKIHINNNHQDEEIFTTFNYGLFPLYDLHLRGGDKRDQQVWIFLGVGIIILIIACINYFNLVTARASRRSKEVGVRKIAGAQNKHLFFHFMYESVLVFAISAIIALLLSFLFLPQYNHLAGKTIQFSLLDYKIWSILIATFLFTVLLAGVYPALVLSRFHLVPALKGNITKTGKRASFREALVIVQFASSVILIVATIIIRQQLHFVRQMDMGYQKENVFTFARHNIRDLDALKSALAETPEILGVSVSSTSRLDNARSITTSIHWDGKPADMNSYYINQLSIDRDFLNVLHIDLTDGAGFTGTAADSTHFLLNETAARQTGLQVGMPLRYQGTDGTVAGIVKDFHFQDMKNKIGPMVLNMDPKWGWDYVYVRTAGNRAKEALAAVEEIWKKYNADYEFSYQFLDDTFDSQYREDIRLGYLFNIFAGMAILISCLGLFGLVTYSVELKVKEIGIRKVLGASLTDILLLITQDFFKLILLAFLIAMPLGWWLMTHWLDNFAYRTEITGWVFLAGATMAFSIALLTVAVKSLNAARQNPIKALRTE